MLVGGLDADRAARRPELQPADRLSDAPGARGPRSRYCAREEIDLNIGRCDGIIGHALRPIADLERIDKRPICRGVEALKVRPGSVVSGGDSDAYLGDLVLGDAE